MQHKKRKERNFFPSHTFIPQTHAHTVSRMKSSICSIKINSSVSRVCSTDTHPKCVCIQKSPEGNGDKMKKEWKEKRNREKTRGNSITIINSPAFNYFIQFLYLNRLTYVHIEGVHWMAIAITHRPSHFHSNYSFSLARERFTSCEYSFRICVDPNSQ